MKRWRLWLLIAVVIACACLPFITQNDYQVRILFRIAIFAALGLAWNLVGGFAGQLSLGHAAFFGLGAYGLAIFTARGVPMWISLLLAALVATLFAAAIGRIAFRLRGPYFTLATIAFAEVLRLTATNLEITGGAIGLDVPTLFAGRSFIRMMYFAAVILALITFLINFATSRSRPGYYLMAIREDEDTASAVGIDTASYKLRALLISAFITALGGALYASSSQHIVPDDAFAMEISVQIAIIAMLGGAGTLAGPVAGAVLLLTASEVFKNQFREGHLLIYGVLIVLVVLFLPDGIVGGLQRLLRRRNPPGSLPGSPDVQPEAGA
ncbi:MAG TPA: branched-chain amino acid ABC transporter permease [Candidatus Angelobacter sp.]|nr:branched-chain amino acid ABC transporter permease [Candidatus Angelobacter sp.]